MATSTKKLEELEKQVANSSEKNRNFFTATLLVLVYLVIVVIQTSDLDLLIGHTVHLPLIGIDMPMLAFYLAAPILVVALHFNLLHNIEQHHAKLCEWRDSHKNQLVPRTSIYPFIFDFSTLDNRTTSSKNQKKLIKITRLVNQIVIYWVGPITILLILWRFTDYQSQGITLWHFFCLSINCTLVISYLKEIDHKSKNVMGVMLWFCGFLQTALLLLVANDCLPNAAIGAPTLSTNFVFPRIIINGRDNLLALDSQNLRFQFDLSEKTEDGKEISDSRPKNTNFHDWFMLHGNGIDLSGNSMRFASFVKADLRRAWLKGTKLQNANFLWAQLQGANFRSAQLQRAGFGMAKSQGAKFVYAQLQGADLYKTQLQEADLTSSNLQRAVLFSAELQGANLAAAQLKGADLTNITIDEKTNFKDVSIDENTKVEVWLNKKGELAESWEIAQKDAVLNQARTDALMAQMRKQGWPETVVKWP